MPYGNDAARLLALKANFGSSKLTGAPATVYVALLRQATAGQENVTLGTEPDSTGGYARVAVSNVDTSWTFGTVSLSNTGEIRFPTATAEYNITDPLNQWALYDNSAGGTCLAFGPLTTTIDVTGANDVPVIPAGALVLTQAA